MLGRSTTALESHASFLTLAQLMPLFYEKSASVAKIKDGMIVQLKVIQFLNPSQNPVKLLNWLSTAAKWQGFCKSYYVTGDTPNHVD